MNFKKTATLLKIPYIFKNALYSPSSPLLTAIVQSAVEVLMGKKSEIGTEIAGKQDSMTLRLSAFSSNVLL